MKADTWYAFECRNGGECGAVLDVRSMLMGFFAPAEQADVTCPFCREPMRFRGSWPADDGGYGSRGNPVTYARQRLGEILECLKDEREAPPWLAARLGEIREALPPTPAQEYAEGGKHPLSVHRRALVEIVEALRAPTLIHALDRALAKTHPGERERFREALREAGEIAGG